MQPLHMFPGVPMPPLLLEVLMTASISGADRSPFSTTAGSQVTVKIPCEEGKEQVPPGPLLIKDGQQDRGIRCKVHGRAREKFGVRCRKGGRGQCLGMPQGVQHDSDSAPQPQTCSCSTHGWAGRSLERQR